MIPAAISKINNFNKMSAFAHSSLDRGGSNGIAGRDAQKVAFIVDMCYFVNS
jgi:hypothetical protein